MRELPPVRFTEADANEAFDVWGANCGPAAIAAIAGMSLQELRPHLCDFEQKRYTNPTLMWRILGRLGIKYDYRTFLPWESERSHISPWPNFGLARVQWEGPWTAPGVPMAARYRHTHWVASARLEEICLTKGYAELQGVFDVNCMSVGGWVGLSTWTDSVVPWLLKHCEPKASGHWHITHSVEVQP